MLRCPICKKPVSPRAQNESFPFCSERCKLVDLGRWLDGDYRIPKRSDESEDGPPPLAPERDESA
ncbi:MAG: DNA gyrase inhibitor YacG [Myxococcales bacterium]|jgi:endogenous inhibitor of DNA gyrase (YacG/DUF329 family)